MKEKQNTHSLLERADYSWSSDSIRLINTPTAAARRTFFYVQEVGCFRTFPPYFTERANLDSFLVIYTISGKGRLRYNEQEYHFLPRTAALINCMERHLYECLSGQEWEFLWLHFNGIGALGYYEEFIRSGFRILACSDTFFMESTMRRILSLTQKKDLHSEIIVSSLIVQILTQLLIENSSESLGTGIMPSYIKEVLNDISRNYSQPLSLDSLARRHNVSKYHLAKQFKAYVGTPPNEYIISTRISRAKELLKYSQKTVEEISYECGFHHTSHFISLFKKHTELTPLQYRKQWG